jgi:DNA-binding response OmpR family regulator
MMQMPGELRRLESWRAGHVTGRPLSGAQLLLLKLLWRHHGEIVRKDAIYAELWGTRQDPPVAANDAIRLVIFRLRKILPKRYCIVNQHGVGWGLADAR